MVRARLISLWVGFSLALLGASAFAQTPATRMVGAELISPSSAWSYYSSVATGRTDTAAALAATPPEITALARTLGSDRAVQEPEAYTQRVFDYVRNNIRVEFKFGVAKGARGALIDGSGTAFDQAELMVKLLTAGGVSASYQVGTITLDPTQLGKWTGVIKGLSGQQTFTVDARSVCEFLADGGIPATFPSGSTCASLSGDLSGSVTVGHIWVSANGKVYDPAFKLHTFKAGVALASVLCGGGDCGAAVASGSGGTPGSANGNVTHQGASESGAHAVVLQHAVSLENHIRGNLPAAELDDVIGGQRIDIAYQPVPAANLPYSATSSYTSWTASNGIPNHFRAKLRLVSGSDFDQTVFSDEIAGRRLRVFIDSTAPSHPWYPGFPRMLKVYADGISIVSVTCANCQPYSYAPVTATVSHPYPRAVSSQPSHADEVAQLFGAGFPLTIIQSWGETSSATQKHISNLQTADPSPFKGDGSTGCSMASKPLAVCRHDSHPTTAVMLLAQMSAAEAIVDGVSGVRRTVHHTIGHYSQSNLGEASPPNDSTHFSVKSRQMLSVQATLSLRSRAGSSAARSGAFEAMAAVGSVLEGTATQQGYGVSFPISGIAGLALAGRDANNTFTDFPPQTSGGPRRIMSSTPTPTAPYPGGVNPWNINDGYTVGGLNYAPDSLGYLINLGAFVLKGGGLSASPDPAADVLKTAKASEIGADRRKYASVSLASGDLSLSPGPDLVTGVGAFPFSLPFQRTYNSGGEAKEFVNGDGSIIYSGEDSNEVARLGGGWTHNFTIGASLVGDTPTALGQNNALDASAAIAAIYDLSRLLESPTLPKRIASFFVGSWLAKQLDMNAFVIRVPGGGETFQKLPSGTFNPRAGSASSLSSTGTTRSGPYYLDELQAPTVWNYSGVSFAYTDRDGAVLNFSVAARKGIKNPSAQGLDSAAQGLVGEPLFKPVNWVFPNGVIVTFNYQTVAPVVFQYPGDGVDWAFEKTYLDRVYNNVGRTLWIDSAAVATNLNGNVIFGRVITGVRDENTRSVTYARTNCPAIAVNNGAGNTNIPYGVAKFNCNTFTATQPGGLVSQYEYTPNSGNADPATLVKTAYKLRRWFTPLSTATPYALFNYDELLRVKSMEQPGGRTTVYRPGGVADETWKRGEAADPMGGLSVSIFDDKNKVLSQTDSLGRRTLYAYDGAGRVIRTENPEGDVITQTYDVRSNPLVRTHSIKPGASSPTAYTTLVTSSEFPPSCSGGYTPKNCNKPISDTDARGGVTNYLWDAGHGGLTAVQAPADLNGNRPYVNVVYQPVGGVFLPAAKSELISASPAVGNQTNYFWGNGTGKLLLQAFRTGSGQFDYTTALTYDAVGNLKQVDGPRDQLVDISLYYWDDNRRLKLAVNPNASPNRTATRYEYDADSQLIATSRGVTDSSGTEGSFAALEKTSAIYDAAGNKVRETVHDGGGGAAVKITDFSYDLNDRLLCTATRMNLSAAAALDPKGANAACSLTDLNTTFGPDRIARNIYDSVGQLLRTDLGVGSSDTRSYASYEYSRNGKQTAIIDAVGNKTTLVYDGFDRLFRREFPVTTRGQKTSSSTDAETYTLDKNGNRTLTVKRDGSQVIDTYDALNRLVYRDRPQMPNQNDRAIRYTYDLRGKMLSAKFVRPASEDGITFVYDILGRKLHEISYGWDVGYDHDKAGMLTNIRYNTGPSSVRDTRIAFDAASQPTGISDGGVVNGLPSGLGTVATFQLDSLGRRQFYLRPRPDGSNPNPSVGSRYDFDGAGRLSRVRHGGSIFYDQQATFNPAGQVYQLTYDSNAYVWQNHPTGNSGDKTYDGLNRDAGIVAIPGGYDGRGNQLTDGYRNFGFDIDNQLVVGGAGQTTVGVAYDPLGRLRATQTNSGVWTWFLYAGDKLVAEFADRNDQTPLRSYAHGPGVDEPFEWYEHSGGSVARTWFYGDRQGSIIATVNYNTFASTPYRYGPYGEPAEGWGLPRFRYTGQATLPEAQVYYYKARVYDPMLGRFLQTDPIDQEDDPNLYAYVGEDPVNKTDPTGTQNMALEMQRELAETRILEQCADAACIKTETQALNQREADVANITAGFIMPMRGVSSVTARIASSERPASSAVSGLKLGKQLASESQLAQLAKTNRVMAGSGTSTKLRDAPRLVKQYGGKAEDWQKVTSSSYKAKDGSRFETHAYRNVRTGRVVEPKTKMLEID